MNFKVNYLGVEADIDTSSKKIVFTDRTNSDTLFNMAVKAIMKNLNFSLNGYHVIRRVMTDD